MYVTRCDVLYISKLGQRLNYSPLIHLRTFLFSIIASEKYRHLGKCFELFNLRLQTKPQHSRRGKEERGQRVTLDLFQALLSSPLLRVSLSDRDVMAR